MAKSKVIVTFNIIPQFNDFVEIGNDLSTTDLFEIFKTNRSSNAEVAIGSSIEEAAFNYRIALGLDYNSSNLYNIFPTGGKIITIEANQEGVIFTENLNNTSGRITMSIDNQPAAPKLTIDDVSFTEADTNPCGNIKVNVTTNVLATKVTSPLLIDPNLANPFNFDWVREVTINIACETATLNANVDVELPAILSVANTTLDLFNTPTGANLTVTHFSTFLLDLQYSLDDITYQTSNIFPGLLPGAYTIYIKDQYGCKIQDDFTVSIFTPDISVTVPDFHRSKAMSIRTKRDTVWGNCSDYKTEENTLSCEYPTLLRHPTIQLFQTCDLIRDQFRTNYDTLAANVIKADGTKDTLSITKVTNFLNKKDKRDSTYYAINATQTGIYFTTGETYDYDTGLPNGNYALNGLLPEWGVVGNYVFLDGIGWSTIVDIITDDDRNADVLVIKYPYLGIETTIIASSNYNLFNFDYFEFNSDMAIYDNQQIQIEILATHTDFPDIRELSEIIEIAERWSDTKEIVYWNTSNTDVFYASGIKNKIRVGYETFYPDVDGNIEGLDTDTNSILLSSTIYETNILVFSPVTVAVMRQIIQSLAHKEVYVDGIKYRLMEIPEIEPYGQTNLQTITATLKKSGNVFDSDLDGTEIQIVSEIEPIGLIKYEDEDTKYLKY